MPTSLCMTREGMMDGARRHGLFQEVGFRLTLSTEHSRDGFQKVNVIGVGILLGESIRELFSDLKIYQKKKKYNSQLTHTTWNGVEIWKKGHEKCHQSPFLNVQNMHDRLYCGVTTIILQTRGVYTCHSS